MRNVFLLLSSFFAFLGCNGGIQIVDCSTLQNANSPSCKTTTITNSNTSIATDGTLITTKKLPEAASGITTTVGTGRVIITWDNQSQATFKLKVGTSSKNYTVVYDNITSPFEVSTLNAGQTYYFVIVTTTSAGTIDSVEFTATIPATGVNPATLLPGSFSISGSIPGNASVGLTWAPSSNAVSYTVKRGIASGNYVDVLSTTTMVTSFLDSSVTNGTTYYYMVTAVNSNGSTDANAEISSTPRPLPGAFTITSATAGDTQVNLIWGSSANSSDYNVFRGTSSGVYSPTPIASGVNSPYLDTGLTNGVTYYYMVAALNLNNQSTNANAEVSATPTAAPLAGPFSITSATPGNTQVNLTWGASTNAINYKIYRGTSSGIYNPTPIATVSASPYLDTGLTNGTPYYYMVAAININNQSTNANAEASATPVAPLLPGTFNITNAIPGNAQINLIWDASTNATSYEIYRGTSSGSYNPVAIATVSVTNYLDNAGLTNGTPYYYIVSAVNGSGNTDANSEIAAAPQAPANDRLLPGEALALGEYRYFGSYSFQLQNDTNFCINSYPGLGWAGIWCSMLVSDGITIARLSLNGKFELATATGCTMGQTKVLYTANTGGTAVRLQLSATPRLSLFDSNNTEIWYHLDGFVAGPGVCQ